MFKGFLSGLFWGGMVGALVLAVLSLYAPLPSSQADAGAGAEVGAQAPAAVTEPEVPATELTSEPAPSEATPSDAPAASDEAVPEIDPSPEAEEETGAVSPLEGVDAEPEITQVADIANDSPSVDIDADEVVSAAESALVETPDPIAEKAPTVVSELGTPRFEDTTDVISVQLPQISEPSVQTPQIPDAIRDTEIALSDQPLVVTEKPIAALPVTVLKTAPGSLGFSGDVAVIAAPELPAAADTSPTTNTTALVAPVISELAPQPVENPNFVRVAERPLARVTPLPQVGVNTPVEVEEVSADTPIGVDVGVIENPVSSTAAQVVTGRLPTVGGVSTTPAGRPISTSSPEVENPSRDALTDNAEQFATNAQSLFSIIIIDVGNEGVAREQLLNSSYPITIAIDPAGPNAAALMAQYRAAGIEIVALLNDLPTSASPSDVAVAISGYFGVVDEAVAVMEPLDRRLQNDRDLLEPVLDAISDTGHGFMTYAQGLNTTRQSARRSGVPSAEIFRILDAEDEPSAKIKRYLKRAAFNAGRDGSVVVVGRSYDNTMTAILEWALENNDASLTLAPISAVLRTDIPPES